ncbi:MAG TPA: DUF3306 domain-containing protein [Burkholderiales bacterium]|nr:DUF3306 domain-containing protein [Burkholderiales bacterium]
MAQEKETFLGRWSRLKQEEKKLPEKKPDPGEAPPLPPLEKLTPESDFTGFMHPKVEDALRRAALKKLFRDPHFNVPDPYEAYSGDWTGGEAISEDFLKTLNQARTHLFSDQPKDKEKEEEAKTETAEKPEQDEPGRKDT